MVTEALLRVVLRPGCAGGDRIILIKFATTCRGGACGGMQLMCSRAGLPFRRS